MALLHRRRLGLGEEVPKALAVGQRPPPRQHFPAGVLMKHLARAPFKRGSVSLGLHEVEMQHLLNSRDLGHDLGVLSCF